MTYSLSLYGHEVGTISLAQPSNFLFILLGLFQWKRRWCVLRRLSPVANSLIMELYKKPLIKSKDYHSKSSINIENLLGLESCFLLQKESQTLAIICKSIVIMLAFENRETLLEWQSRISDILGQGSGFQFFHVSLL